MEAAQCAKVPPPEGRTILVAEDEVLLRLDLADELREKGYLVVEAANAEEALSILRSSVRVDLVLTDIRMPGAMDGLDLVRRVSAEFPYVKVVLVSAESPDREVHDTIDGFFSKPCDVERIAAHAGRLLAVD